MSKIKECPFCGKEARTWRQGFVRIQLCACSDDLCCAYFLKATPSEWNTRAQLDKQDATKRPLSIFNICIEDKDCPVRIMNPQDYKEIHIYRATKQDTSEIVAEIDAALKMRGSLWHLRSVEAEEVLDLLTKIRKHLTT